MKDADRNEIRKLRDEIASLRSEIADLRKHVPHSCFHYHYSGCCGCCGHAHWHSTPAITWTYPAVNTAAGSYPVTITTTNSSGSYQLPSGGSN